MSTLFQRKAWKITQFFLSHTASVNPKEVQEILQSIETHILYTKSQGKINKKINGKINILDKKNQGKNQYENQ